jgi:hypothetical protein
MKIRKIFLFLIILLLNLSISWAGEKSQMQEIVDIVKSICLAPSEKGAYWDVKLTGDGVARVKLKKLTELGISGDAEFTKGEWEGVQRVLEEERLKEHVDYRECVEKLTPLFIKKFNSVNVSNQIKGYIHLTRVRKIDGKISTDPVAGDILQITASEVLVRLGPDFHSKILGTLNGGSMVRTLSIIEQWVQVEGPISND